jgi:LuxR family transcriptional regulator, maltose regulon positive regulatory protein
VGLSEIECEAGQLDSAREHLKVAAALTEGAPAESRYRWTVAMARLAEAAGDPNEAIQLLDQAEGLYRREFFPNVRPVAAMRARVWIADGNLSQAAHWAAEREISVTGQADYLSEFDHLSLVRLLIAQHRTGHHRAGLDQPADLLARLLRAADASGRAGSVVEIRMMQALANHALGRRLEARRALARALAEAPEPAGYAQLFLSEGVPMRELLNDATHHHSGASDHAHRILSLSASAGGRRGGSQQPPTALSERELQVLKLLSSDLTGPQIARELFVSHNTVRTHTKHIFGKLEVTSRRAAVRQARESGLL